MPMADPFDETTWTDKDRFYYEYLDGMLVDGVDARVSNAEPKHAAYVLRALLTHAKRYVRLFAGNLGAAETRAVFESPAFADAAKKLLSQQGSKFVIVVGEGDDDSQVSDFEPLVKAIEKLASQGEIAGMMEVRRAPQAAVDFLREHNRHHPLAVMDESAYRVETGNSALPAYANFGDRKTARSYAAMFDDVLYRDSEEIVAVPSGGAEAA